MAVYFPQYHPDPINDRNWGVNFTDWTSLRGAPERNRAGYTIPRPTAHLGYYDLRSTATRRAQGVLARDHKVDGFVVHHYWFYDPTSPGPTLHAPLLGLLQDGEPNVPFFFNWCASSWTSVWTAKVQVKEGAKPPTSTLVQEQFFDVPDAAVEAHYAWLRPFFHHANYIKIHGQPVFMAYQWFPQSTHILERLRALAQADGWPGLYFMVGRGATHPDLVAIHSLTAQQQNKWKRTVQHPESFPPTGTDRSLWNQSVAYPYPHEWVTKAYEVPDWCRGAASNGRGHAASASDEIPSLLTTFDNTPRREFDSATFYNVDEPDKVVTRFRDSLYAAVYLKTCCVNAAATGHAADPERRFVLINAWNEWAEGMALEPSNVYQTRFLEAIRDVKAQIQREGCIL
jgi:hypothetical protein